MEVPNSMNKVEDMPQLVEGKWLLDKERDIYFTYTSIEGEGLPIPLKANEVLKDALSTLNDDQIKAFVKIMEDLQNPEKEFFCIEGYAGTGKTYLIGKVVQCIDGAVAVSAPTNKAVKVLYDHRGDFGETDDKSYSKKEDEPNRNVSYATIHRLLALRVQWTRPARGSYEEPKQILVRNYRSHPSVNQYLLLVIDEASMLDDDLFEMLNAEKNKELKVIFMGDSAQIPPINKNDSIPLMNEEREKWGIGHAILETIMRQEGDNKILQTAYQIRNGRFKEGDPILSRVSNDDVLFYNSMRIEDKKEFIGLMVTHFLGKEFNEDANYCKVIAWTNKMVNTCNEIIRRSIYPNAIRLNKIMQDEKLIANKPVFNEAHEIIFNTSDEFTVEEFLVKELVYYIPEKGSELLEQLDLELKGTEVKGHSGNQFLFKYYDCMVRYRTKSDSEGWLVRIEVLHESSEKAFWYMMKKLKQRKNWEEYTKMIEKFADVKYNYAITAHKSQGSTYRTVFLMEDDIDQNRKTLERNRIKYTACTRPKNKLFILSKLNQSREQQEKYIEKANAGLSGNS